MSKIFHSNLSQQFIKELRRLKVGKTSQIIILIMEASAEKLTYDDSFKILVTAFIYFFRREVVHQDVNKTVNPRKAMTTHTSSKRVTKCVNLRKGIRFSDRFQ